MGRAASPRRRRLALAVLPLLLGSCATVAPREDVLYLNLIWHQHQPLYYREAGTGTYSRPWVRVHATKDYVDMAAMLERYPGVKVTFNLTPVLLKQLDQYLAGAKDAYWVLAEKPAASLTPEDRRFILERFFDANERNIIRRFPGYARLYDSRGGSSAAAIERAVSSWSVEDMRDLQLWFNLAWFDPDFLAAEPLLQLVRKDHGFSEADKAVVFGEVRRVMAELIPVHKRLQDRGQIEVTTTPYAHPILPLIFNSDLVKKNDPTAEVPTRFSYPQDAIAQLGKSVEVYRQHFGRSPAGLWPGEGSVAQEIVKLVADAGYRWMASGEQVLARSLGMQGFTRDAAGVVEQADQLYRPYYVRHDDGKPVAVAFRDTVLADLIGFEYSGTPGAQAAANLMERLERIRSRLRADGTQGSHLVTIVVDGENAWENYPNDGKEFLNSLYRMLSESETIRTTTMSGYLRLYPEQRSIDELWPGCWFTPDFSTWIGEPEETIAWEYLGKTRAALARYDLYKRRSTTPERLAAALDAMYLAEGSDWFWWYGSDQDSGVDSYFDRAYRELLAEVYRSLGEPVPSYVSVPIVPPAAVTPERQAKGALEVTVDGVATDAEWAAAARLGGGSEAASLSYGVDSRGICLRVEAVEEAASARASELLVYLAHPAQRVSTELGEDDVALGLRASHRVVFPLDGSGGARAEKRTDAGLWEVADAVPEAAVGPKAVEMRIPLGMFPESSPGDVLRMQLALRVAGRLEPFPPTGPVEILLPEPQGMVEILRIADPRGDDHGSGGYVYPTDAVFTAGCFDAEALTILETDSSLVARFDMAAPVTNPWGSAVRLSLQTFDLYIDVDPGAGTGATKLLEGRNASLAPGFGWEYAVWVEGWNQKVLVPDAARKPTELPGTPVKVLVSEADGVVTILVDKRALGAAPVRTWAVAAAVLSQDGFPSAGVRRVRDVLPAAAQWRFGGAAEGASATRVIDLLWPEGSETDQAAILGSGEIPMLRLGGS